MTARPWVAEFAVRAEDAAAAIDAQCPELAPSRVELLDEGWDNVAFLVNDEFIFRFPRRAVAVELLETECALLPFVAPRVPLPISAPTHVGRLGDHPFMGYPRIDGETADRLDLDRAARARSAEAMGAFLAQLHAIPVEEARGHGAAGDTIRRLDVTHRTTKLIERLEHAVAIGLVDDVAAWDAIVDDALRARVRGEAALVHGDLYARQVIARADGTLTGVIDWGDVHLGDPAIDLAFAHAFLPPEAHDAFFGAYGDVDDDARRLARFRAMAHAVTIMVYGADVGDDDLVRECRVALAFLREAIDFRS